MRIVEELVEIWPNEVCDKGYIVLTIATRTRGKATMNSRLQGSEGKLDNTHPYQVT